VNDDVDVVHIQHETYLFGGLFSAFAFPVLLAMLKLARKPVIVTLHGVIPLSRIDRVFLKENQINGNPILMKYGLSLLVKTIVSISNAIIVHEGALKEVLVKEYKCSFTKVHVIHHGIEEPKALVSAEEAKRKLGTSSRKVILFFGYITGYKHLELLIESARFINVSNWVMMIAGGSHPRLSEDPDYIKYLTDLKTEASQISKNILFEGFVSEPDIPTYFSSADVVVFPYNILISSSGPLSLAVSYRRPFLVSASFRDTVNYNEIVFGNNPKELADKLNLFFKDPQYNFRVTKFADEFRLNRSWKKISQQTFTLYEESKKIVELSPIFGGI
jgi:glycosyltransferase involved in cell wall biosynthesis